MYREKSQSGNLGKVVVVYEHKPTNVMLTVVVDMEKNRWETFLQTVPRWTKDI